MQASNIPSYKWLYVWAIGTTSSYINLIPETNVNPNEASQYLGFPPNTFVATGAGGEPPSGKDFNGAYQMVTAWEQWYQAGGIFIPFDGGFSTQIGGYPAGAALQSESGPGLLWVNSVDNNTNDPDSNEGGWNAVTLLPLFGPDTGTANAVVVTLSTNFSNLSDFNGRLITIHKGSSVNTGPVTITLNSFPTKPLAHSDGSAIGANELPANAYFTVVWDNGLGIFELQSLGYKLGTAATKFSSSLVDTIVSSVTGVPVTSGNIPVFSDTNGTVSDSGVAAASLASGLVVAWAITDGSTIFANLNINSISNSGTGVYVVGLAIAPAHGGAIFYSSGSGGGSAVWGGSGNGSTSPDITANTFTLTTNNAGGSGGQRANIASAGVLIVFGTP